MFIADGDLDSMLIDGKMFVDFDGLVEHYLMSLVFTEQEFDFSNADEASIASFRTASVIGEALLNTLYLCHQKVALQSEIETLLD